MKTGEKKGFTLVELLTAVAIVIMLLGLLMPALSLVRKLANQTKQKAQIGSIEIALNMYKNDFGQYPPSHGWKTTASDHNDYHYSGAQTLAEALVGYDLLGVHSDSVFRADGKDNSTPTNQILYPSDPNKTNLSKRKGPYIDRTNVGVFEPNDIFVNTSYFSFPGKYPQRYMICDVFTALSKRIGGKTYKIGTPVLYFRANPSANNTVLMPYLVQNDHLNNIYNYCDNYDLISAGRISDGTAHELNKTTVYGDAFYKFIRDQMIPIFSNPVGNYGRPVKPDSFLLISAGADGIYGTKDDICNFEPNIE